MKNLRPIVQPDLGTHWASEGVSEHTREIVTRYFSEDMPAYDAKALLWYVRNVLFFEQGLHERPSVFLCKYEDFVTRPATVMQSIYRFLESPYPGNFVVKKVHNRSVGLGQDIEIREELDRLCVDLLQKLDRVYWSQPITKT